MFRRRGEAWQRTALVVVSSQRPLASWLGWSVILLLGGVCRKVGSVKDDQGRAAEPCGSWADAPRHSDVGTLAARLAPKSKRPLLFAIDDIMHCYAL